VSKSTKYHVGLDNKTYWLTDRQLQCVFEFDFNLAGRQLRAAEAGSWGRVYFGNLDERERPYVEAATKQRLVKTVTENASLCVMVICKA
jgi:hypothetical protein